MGSISSQPSGGGFLLRFTLGIALETKELYKEVPGCLKVLENTRTKEMKTVVRDISPKISVPLHHFLLRCKNELYRCPPSPNAALRPGGEPPQRALNHPLHRAPPQIPLNFRQPQPALADGRQPPKSPPERPGAAQAVPAAKEQERRGRKAQAPLTLRAPQPPRRTASDVTRGLRQRALPAPLR